MISPGYQLFDTAIGRCGIAWGRGGIVGVQLPEARVAETRARLRKRFPEAKEGEPPTDVQRAVDAIVALLAGEARDLSRIRLDMENVSPFHRRVYEAARKVGPGATCSYGEIAKQIGAPGSARAVGQALGRNPFAILVPCHRVLAAGGKTGGFTAEGGVSTKLRMLAIEGAQAGAQLPLVAAREEQAYGFDVPAALAHLRAADETMGRLIESVGAFAMERKATASPFLALLEAIIHQQLNGKAAATIHGRVCGLFPRTRGGPTPEHILGASDEMLRGAGLSQAKMLALRDLARRTRDGEVPTLVQLRKMDDDAIVERLTAVRGIGRWTAEMLLMFRLGRPDVLPVDDFGVRKGYAVAYRKREMPKPADLAKYGECWKPYRSVASWYLWRAADGAKA